MTDFCASICPIRKAFMWLNQHGKFAWSDFDSIDLRAADSKLVSEIVLAKLHPNSENTVDEETRAAALSFTEKVTLVSACRRRTALETQPGLHATQLMPGRTRHFLCTPYEN